MGSLSKTLYQHTTIVQKNIKMLKTSSNNIKLLLLSNIFTSFVVSSSQVVSTWKMNEPGCEGSLVIFDTSNQKHTIGKDNDFLVDKMNIEVRSLHVEGCGCFRVNKGERGEDNLRKLIVEENSVKKKLDSRRLKAPEEFYVRSKRNLPGWSLFWGWRLLQSNVTDQDFLDYPRKTQLEKMLQNQTYMDNNINSILNMNF